MYDNAHGCHHNAVQQQCRECNDIMFVNTISINQDKVLPLPRFQRESVNSALSTLKLFTSCFTVNF